MWKRNGHPEARQILRGEGPEARFWQKALRAGPDDCWWWTGATSGGYGHFWIDAERGPIGAHLYACELAGSPIPDGLEAMHSCDHKLCVNTAHLGPGTHAQNMAEAADRGLCYAPNKGGLEDAFRTGV